MLTVRDVSVWLGSRLVLDRVSFQATAGECIFVLGPNGAGKSTLLRAIAGLLGHEGTIDIEGRSFGADRARARRVAYLPQGHAVHWPLTARDVVAIGRLPHGSSIVHPSQEDAAAIERALAAADAIAFADRPVTDLSGGERARVLLARALAVEAPLLLADEPTSALDPAHQLAIAEVLSNLCRNGRVVVAAMHDLVLATRFATRVLVLEDGRVAADGAPADVLDEALLARAFAIRSVWSQHDDKRVLIPWARVQTHR